ncbi:MAG: toll/interleukin-1 receptor domain-containing protein [Rubrobacteraceae bacterium]
MSMLSIYQNKVGKLTADIALLRKKLSGERDKEAKKNRELTRTTRSLAGTKSSSTRRMKENKATRLMGETATIQKNIADLESEIAGKTKDLHTAEQRLTRERDKQNKARRSGELKHQKTLTRTVEDRRRLETLHGTLAAEFPDYEASSSEDVEYDIFISHASEDKEDFVEPLAELLSGMGFKVWYDDFVLDVGDSLSRSIDMGIANSGYGLVVLSPQFFTKGWTERELAGLTAREVAGRRKLILPVWHNVTHEDVLEYSPMLADKVALDTGKMSLEEIAEALAEVLPGLVDEEGDALIKARASFGSDTEAFDDATDPDTLAKEQSVSAANFDDLAGDFWPEEEEPEEFTTALREWRRDPPHRNT